MKNEIEIHFDGGCRPTNPGNKYGSFQVIFLEREIFRGTRIELGIGTNNEAEFDILLHALKWTHESLVKAGMSDGAFDLKLFTDSTIVRNRIAKQNCSGKSEPAARMARLTEQCLALITAYKSAEIKWQARAENVARFGH